MNKAISNGNRQTETRNAGTMPYVYSPTGSNGLFQTGSTSRYKTANGNTQSIGSTSFTYDGFNRLATAQTAAETTTYTYNALGERVRKVNQNGLATVFHYGPDGKLLYERDQAGNTKEYVWLGQRPLARIDNQTSIYTYHVDHLGTPQMMSDDTGSLVWKATYEPFGKASISPASTVENNLRFPGQYFDRETGMHYNYYRSAYNPGTGRYEEADPVGIEGGLNVYGYANQNPLTYVDPTGEFGLPAALGMAAAFYFGIDGYAYLQEAKWKMDDLRQLQKIKNAQLGACSNYPQGGACSSLQDTDKAINRCARESIPVAHDAAYSWAPSPAEKMIDKLKSRAEK